MNQSTPRRRSGRGVFAKLLVTLAVSIALALTAVSVAADAGATASTAIGGVTPRGSTASSTVWLCRPGLANDPCTSSLTATAVTASGTTSVVKASVAPNPHFDCFYVYPTVSRELTTNADLRVQKTEIAAAVTQASRFSQVCRVYAPIYQQVTDAGLAQYPNLDVPASYDDTAYNSVLAGFKEYLSRYNDGRPIVLIGHSQGAAVLITLLQHMVDNNASLRNRLVLAVILGGDVEVRTGALDGGSFSHIPVCTRSGEAGCVLAYSSFPDRPPAASLFGRPGQGVALQSGQTAKKGLQVVCVNPAAFSGGAADLDPYFPADGVAPTPWVEYPGLYHARCETAAGATWLQVTKATSSSDERPVVTEAAGPDWGYHADDVNLALGNLVDDVASAEAAWSSSHRSGE